ncbi:MAG: hypothetical protein P1U34_09345 [Coxiellaceae bacterium]|nr:hypothetical protein [Coxiellaceae bacterium]
MRSKKNSDFLCVLGSVVIGVSLLTIAILGTIYNNRACDDGNNVIADVLQNNVCNIGSQSGNANETVVLNAAKACFAICAGISAANMSAVDDRLDAARDQMSRLVNSSAVTFYHSFMAASMILGLIGFICAMSAAISHEEAVEQESSQALETLDDSDLGRSLLSAASPV